MARIRPLREETSPIDGESARGLFCRALGDHGVPLSFTVLRRLGMQHRNVVTISEDPFLDIAEMACVIRVDPGEIEKRRYEPLGRRRLSFFGLTIPASAIEKKSRRFSPAALRKSPHIRAIWELREIPFCPETWEILVDTCVCRTRQGWIRLNGVHRCDDCGRELWRVPTDSVPVDMREALSLIAGIVNPITAERSGALAVLPKPLQSGDRSALYEAAMLLREVIAGKDVGVAENLAALHAACVAMIEWPAGMVGMKPAVGTPPAMWRRALKTYADLASPAALPIGGGSSTTADSSRTRTSPEALIGIRPAYEMARLTLKTMLAARERGHLPRHEMMRAGSMVPAFLPTEVTAFAEAYRARRGPDVVGYGIGLGRRAVCEIAALGHMTSTGLSLADDETWFTDDDVEALHAAIAGSQSKRIGDPIPMRHAMMAINGRPKPWAGVVGAMLDKAIPFLISAGEAPLFDRVHVDRGDIAFIAGLPSSIVTDPRVGDRLTKGEALELLNAKVSSGALSGLRSTGTNPALYSLDEVVQLAQKGITVLEVAVTTGCDYSSAYAQIRRGGVVAIADSFWDRRQVDALLTP